MSRTISILALLFAAAVGPAASGQRPAAPPWRPAARSEVGEQPSPGAGPALRPVSFERMASAPPRASTQAADGAALQLAPRQRASRLELRPPGSKSPSDAPSASSSLVTIVAGLSVVLGLFFLLVWLLRRHTPAGAQAIPTDVLEVLGRATLQGKHQLNLVRVGGKLLLVSVSAAGAETLTEITDVDEVVRLTGLCRQTDPKSDSAAFRTILEQIGRERHPPGFVDPAGGQAQDLSAQLQGRSRESSRA